MSNLEDGLDRFIHHMGRVTRARVYMDEAQRLDRECRPSCGNCYHWMKSRSCPREARGEKPSMNGLACGTFQEDTKVQRLRDLASESRAKAEAALTDGATI